MKFISVIDEALAGGAVGSPISMDDEDSSYCEIYVDPRPSEMYSVSEKRIPSMAGQIRFIADDTTKKFYVFPQNLLHYKAASTLGLQYRKGESFNPNIFFGDGYYENQSNKIMDISSSIITNLELDDPSSTTHKADVKFMKEFLKHDWSWIQKWADIETFFELNRALRKSAMHHKR